MQRAHLLALLLLSPAAFSATLTGRIVDAKTGEPVAKAEVIATASGQRARTDAKGAFALTLPAGDVELYITTIGYGLVKKTVLVSGTPVEIALQQDAAVRKDAVTVSAGPFDSIESNPASERTLSKSEIQALSMVLISDPLRAAQALPGVTGGNDFRAEFAVRGAGPDHVAIFVDGVLTDQFVHAANLGVGGTTSSEKLSLSIINSDNVAEISLLPGAYPAKSGDSTAAVLQIDTREGNFVKPAWRIATGLLATSAVVDGPFRGHKGSWLLSGRSSYADYLQRFVERITGTGRNADEHSDPASSLNFSDAQTKGTYNFSPRQQVGISATYGLFIAKQDLEAGTANLDEFKRVESQNLLVNAFWRYTPATRFVLQTRAFAIGDETRDKNRNDALLDNTYRRQTGFRTDAGWIIGRQNIEGGVYVRALSERRRTNAFSGLLPAAVEDFDEAAGEDSYYLQDTWRAKGLALTLGGRIAHSNLTRQTVAMPRGALTWSPYESWTLRAGAGTYSQFPRFDQIFGFFGNRKLRAEQASHYNLSLERRFGVRTRVTAEVYGREDRNQIFGFYEPFLVAGVGTIHFRPYQNALRGHARGVETSVQRRSANGLTGWLSYAYATTDYVDRRDQLRFVSDFDQRHTVTAIGSYRIRPTVDVSSQWRFGSGVVIPGFIQRSGTSLSLSSERNTSHLPSYQRLDVRANKAFLFPKWKLTLSAEVLNVLNRVNYIVVSTDPLRVYNSGRFSGGYETSFGVLPALAVAIAF